MKKKMAFIAGILFLGATSLFAQADSTASPRQSDQTKPTSSENARQRDQTQSQSTSNMNDRVKIQQSDLPANLRQTLQGSEYKGWENGTFYRLKNGDGYYVEMKDGTRTRTHRFDANGKPQNQ